MEKTQNTKLEKLGVNSIKLGVYVRMFDKVSC